MSKLEQPSDGGSPGMNCSPSLDTPETEAWMMSTTDFVNTCIPLARKLERERNYWRKEHDRVVCEYQHRLMELATSAITASHYPENAGSDAPGAIEQP